MVKKWLFYMLLLLLCIIAIIFTGIRIVGYFSDQAEKREISEKLKETYYSETNETPEPPNTLDNEDDSDALASIARPDFMEVTNEATVNATSNQAGSSSNAFEDIQESIPGLAFAAVTESPVVFITETDATNMNQVEETPAVAPPISDVSPLKRLPAVNYSDQAPKADISNDFLKLKKTNPDIIGWLNIKDVVDEAVVQKDNEKYLTYDYLNKKNINGALFLQDDIPLETRPYTLIIYGHNMRSGAMFGKLSNYQKVSWYKKHAFATFDSQYEDGRYVIFAAAKIQVVPGNRFVDMFSLLTDIPDERQKIITELEELSFFKTFVDVLPSDQILLMVTCDGNNDERFVVAARRIRDDETESSLNLQVVQSSQAR